MFYTHCRSVSFSFYTLSKTTLLGFRCCIPDSLSYLQTAFIEMVVNISVPSTRALHQCFESITS